MMDTCLCMGASSRPFTGATRRPRQREKSVAVIGDSTLLHSGITGLMDIAYNQSDSVVIILDNSITGMTGHQQNPSTGLTLRRPAAAVSLENSAEAVGIRRIAVVDNNLGRNRKAIKAELGAGPSVAISRRPCALLKYVKHDAP